jgi:hypothetical protein
MANELTYDPTDYDQGEFSEEELDSLRVGNELAAEEEQLLAGKYRDAEELEQAYIELQRKFGSRGNEPDTEPEYETDEEEEREPIDVDTSLIDAVLEQAANGEFTDDLLDVVENLSAADVLDLIVQRGGVDQVQPLSADTVADFQQMVGGEEAYHSMTAWAADNLPPGEVAAFDGVIERGNPEAIYFAIQALALRYQDAQGYDGELLTGRAPTNNVDAFRSQAEVVRAMNDPRYENDPAYRQDVFDKLERSNLQY